MVYTGSRSTGCERCRQRKIKCDKKRPGCQRCELNKAQCPGYDRPLDIRFHGGPRGFVCRKPREEKKTTEAVVTDRASPKRVEDGHDVRGGILSLRQPRPVWDDESVCYFVHEFSFAPKPDLCSGHLEFLQGLLESSCETSPLRPATLASSYLSLSRHYKSPELYVQARKHYGTALQSIRTILSKPLESWQEEILAAIMLLHMFEDTDAIVSDERASHLQAIAGLYATRGQSLLSSLRGPSLYPWVFSQLQIHAFTTNQTFNCLAVPASEVNIAHPPTGVVVMVSKVGRFWFELQQLLEEDDIRDPVQHRDRLITMMHEAMVTQSEIQRWETSLPATWKPREIDAGGQLFVTYAIRWLGITWIMYSATLAIFYHGVLCCCRALTSINHTIHSQSYSSDARAVENSLIATSFAMAEQNIVQLIERICNSIPFSLGEVDCNGHRLSIPDYKGCVCYHLIWPLALVTRSQHSSKDQVQLCRETLARIQNMYGIHLAQCVGGEYGVLIVLATIEEPGEVEAAVL
ncbi:hypothetical protein BJY01DRAFT_247784 [Aspergillus pseudoustus]|uniref:Zn(2)-C6 fungal-type domain-containing protein n=1 Tax=Aspergillus pseudoustus TaxID=1810923 RepID=A0ABR4JZ44_9EURO